jgi:hypothetical protein
MLNTSYIFLQEKVHNDHPLCVCVRERERERERTRECTTCEANPAILNQNDLLRKPQRMILMGYCCCGYIDSRAFHDYLDMTLVAPFSSS